MGKPNFIKKTGNFVQAVARHAASGFSKAPDNIIKERLDICSSCEYFEPSKRVCLKCGCFLDIKVTWASEACPIKKWIAFSAKKPGGFTNLPDSEPPVSFFYSGCNCGGDSPSS